MFKINFLMSTVVAFFYHLSAACYGQKLTDQSFYTISPRGLNMISIKNDTMITRNCLDPNVETGIESKDVIISSNMIDGYNYNVCKNLYTKYEINHTDKLFTYIFKKTTENDPIQIVGEILPYDETISQSSYKPNEKFYFSGYSPTLIQRFKAFRKITSIKNDEIEHLLRLYNKGLQLNATKVRNTKTGDIYGTSIAREFLNRALIEMKIDPTVRQDTLFGVVQKYIK